MVEQNPRRPKSYLAFYTTLHFCSESVPSQRVLYLD